MGLEVPVSLRSWGSLHGPCSLPSLSQSMVGSDTAELLMQDCRRREKYESQNATANLIGLTDDERMLRQPGTLDLITGEVPPVVETQAQTVEKFTKLLYYGRKKVSGEWDPGCRADLFLAPLASSGFKRKGGQEMPCGWWYQPFKLFVQQGLWQ